MMTDYAAIVRQAERIKQAKWADYVPLPLSCAVDTLQDYDVKRPTERLAVFLWRSGVLPHEAHTTGFVGSVAARSSNYDLPWSDVTEEAWAVQRGQTPRQTHRVCKCCGKTKPLNKDHWHRNASSLLGYNTICKNCRLK